MILLGDDAGCCGEACRDPLPGFINTGSEVGTPSRYLGDPGPPFPCDIYKNFFFTKLEHHYTTSRQIPEAFYRLHTFEGGLEEPHLYGARGEPCG